MATRRAVTAGFLGVVLAGTWFLISAVFGREPTPIDPPQPTPTRIPTRTFSPRPTASPTPTQSPTPTGTPPDSTPGVLLVNLVSEWNVEGDAAENAIQSLRPDSTAVIAFRYRAFVHEGTLRLSISVTVASSSGSQIAARKVDVDRSMDGSGTIVEEGVARFPTGEWSPGEKRAKVVVRDEVTGRVSEPKAVGFEVLEPTPRG